MIVAYLSGHGFGHSTRVGEVLRAVRAQSPEIAIAVVTAAPEMLFREALLAPFLYRRLECDVGLAQRGALLIDEEETLARWRAFEAEQPRRIEAEAAWLRQVGAGVVLADLPPLGFEAAAAAGVPGVGLANFSWDWIYRHLARHQPRFEAPARRPPPPTPRPACCSSCRSRATWVRSPAARPSPWWRGVSGAHARRPAASSAWVRSRWSWFRSAGSVYPGSPHASWRGCRTTGSSWRRTRPSFPRT